MKVNILQIQNTVYPTKEETFAHIENLIQQSPHDNIHFLMLPEMFNCPYDHDAFPLYKEKYQGPSYKFLANLAKKYHCYLIGGSIPQEADDGKLYNTCYIFNDQGQEMEAYRKIHLFAINIPGQQVFDEANTFSPGEEIVLLPTKYGKIGICICFDLRFPELCATMAAGGTEIIFVPAAFNTTTGPKHWDLLFKARAVDNQVFMVGTSPAFNKNAKYLAWGHSLVVSPWGEIINQVAAKATTLFTTIDLSEVKTVRQQLPLQHARENRIHKKYQWK